MAIELDANIVFDPDGTLRATTSWISKHDEGLAELLKNVRYAYLPNRADVETKHHLAAILLVDSNESVPARIGVLDVGGATLADLTRWSVWQDQGASLVDGVTQGNGGKAYLFRLFSGEARLLGVKDGKRNCKGFEGAPGSKERGTPGFMPTTVVGREAPISSLTAELDELLKPYALTHNELPKSLLSAIKQRGAFTLAEGVGAKDIWRGKIPADDLIQSTLLRPNDGPMMRALDKFITEKLRELANQISAKNRVELDEKELDAVHRENQKLDQWKNQFLPTNGQQGEGGLDGDGPGSKRRRQRNPAKWGTTPVAIDIEHANETLKVGKGVSLPIDWFLQPHVIDADGLPVRGSDLIWCCDNPHVADFPNPKERRLVAKQKGQCSVWSEIKGTPIKSEPVHIDVWVVDHVLLTPRDLKVPLGTRQMITAEVTNEDGQRSVDVLLNWEHDADDSQIVRIAPTGSVAGNKLGRTTVSAGAGDPKAGGVWARVRAEIEVVENSNLDYKGGGFPTLKLTDKDIDPLTGTKRPSDPDEALYQGVFDYGQNIWWLNLGSKEAEAAFNRRNDNPQAWRLYHAQKVVEMVIHVHMKNEYTSRAEGEVPGLWNDHWSTFSRLQKTYIPMMWEKLNGYLLTGAGLD
jgi:hypothetical protein